MSASTEHGSIEGQRGVRPWRRILQSDLPPLLFFFTVAAALTWPAIVHPSRTIIGDNFIFSQYWVIDQVARGLQRFGTLIVTSTDMNYPEGGSVTFIGWSLIIPVVILRALGANFLASVNWILVLYLLLGCYFAYRLARRLTHKIPESMVAGLIFGTCPFVLSVLWNGQIEKMAYVFLPLLLLLLAGFIEKGRTRTLVAFGLLFGLVLATDPYDGIFGVLLCVLAGAAVLINPLGQNRRKILRRLSLTAVSAGCGSLPFLYYWRISQNIPGKDWLLMGAKLGLEYIFNSPNEATLAGWLVPTRINPSAAIHDYGTLPVLHVHYVGWLPVLLAGLGIIFVALRKNRKFQQDDGTGTVALAEILSPGYFIFTAIFFFVLAMGYFLHTSGRNPLFLSRQVVLPLYWLAQAFPGIIAFNMPYRAVIGVMLAVSMLAAYGLAWAGGRFGNIGRGLLCMAMIGGLFAEARLLSPVPLPLLVREFPVPQVYRDLAALEDCGSVNEIPERWSQPYTYFQTVHHHPLVMSFDKLPRYKAHPIEKSLFQQRLWKVFGELKSLNSAPPADWFLLDFDYLILHERLIDTQNLSAVVAFLESALILVRQYSEDGVRLYRTRRPPADLGPSEIQASAEQGQFFRDPTLPAGCP